MTKQPEKNGPGKITAADRRKQERRKSTKVIDENPLRRNEDWEKIDRELKE